MATEDLNERTPSGDKPADEQDLARRASSGDRRAFAALYDLHVEAVYRYAFYRVRTDAEAEDVTSDVPARPRRDATVRAASPVPRVPLHDRPEHRDRPPPPSAAGGELRRRHRASERRARP